MILRSACPLLVIEIRLLNMSPDLCRAALVTLSPSPEKVISADPFSGRVYLLADTFGSNQAIILDYLPPPIHKE